FTEKGFGGEKRTWFGGGDGVWSRRRRCVGRGRERCFGGPSGRTDGLYRGRLRSQRDAAGGGRKLPSGGGPAGGFAGRKDGLWRWGLFGLCLFGADRRRHAGAAAGL